VPQPGPNIKSCTLRSGEALTSFQVGDRNPNLDIDLPSHRNQHLQKAPSNRLPLLDALRLQRRRHDQRLRLLDSLSHCQNRHGQRYSPNYPLPLRKPLPLKIHDPHPKPHPTQPTNQLQTTLPTLTTTSTLSLITLTTTVSVPAVTGTPVYCGIPGCATGDNLISQAGSSTPDTPTSPQDSSALCKTNAQCQSYLYGNNPDGTSYCHLFSSGVGGAFQQGSSSTAYCQSWQLFDRDCTCSEGVLRGTGQRKSHVLLAGGWGG
jgi:hypothetical protein